MPDNQVTVAQGLARLPGPEGERFVELFGHGTLSVELYAPRGTDPQTPHTRDEVYVVARARAVPERRRAPSVRARATCLFVPAGVVHRFEEFSDDLAVWVFFYGPRAGSAAVSVERRTVAGWSAHCRARLPRRPRRSPGSGSGSSAASGSASAARRSLPGRATTW